MMPASAFDSVEVRERVLDDVEIWLVLLRECEYDMTAVRMSQAYMWFSATAFVVNDIRDKREGRLS